MTSVDETESDHGHHLPAVDDWPQGFGEASWWPFITALGAAGVYGGVALFILSLSADPFVPAFVGAAVFVASTGLFLAGLYGWTYHAFVKNYWSESGTGGKKLRWGMLTFLSTEIATFGAGFTYYFFIRVGPQWGEAHFPDLVSSLVLVNTAILVLSSITLHYGHVALTKGNRTRFVRLLVVTLVLGVVFIGGQIYEYYEFVVHHDFTLTSGIFASAFYGLTGLHGLHVSLGAVLLGIVAVRAFKGQYSADRHTSVTTVSMYWHFVDAVWIFLVVVLYFGAEI